MTGKPDEAAVVDLAKQIYYAEDAWRFERAFYESDNATQERYIARAQQRLGWPCPKLCIE